MSKAITNTITCLTAGMILCATDALATSKATVAIQIHSSSNKSSALQLEARQATLADIFKQLSVKTGAIIHTATGGQVPALGTSAVDYAQDVNQ